MQNQTYREIELSRITPNSWNPRQNFSGPKFDELVASIRSSGVLEPILVRPVKDRFEIVFGERRYRASCIIAKENGFAGVPIIPALVRDLSDDEAFEITAIENLHREDLSELEEARGFKAYLDRKGEDSLPDLAERVGIDSRYIRRRIHVLTLPKEVLKAWDKGKIKYGHVEQLARLNDRKEIAELLKMISQGHFHVRTVKDLKLQIDDWAPKLSAAKFKIKKCASCSQNSDVQKSLFGDLGAMAKTHCLDPKCFKQKQNNHFLKNWEKKYGKKYRTPGFRFYGDLSYSEYEHFYSRVPTACKRCQHLTTLINLDGTCRHEQVCIGDSSCYQQKTRKKEKGASAAAGFRFYGDLSYSEYEHFYSRVPTACKRCQHLTTLINLDGTCRHEQVCIGDSSCYQQKTRKKEKGASAAAGAKKSGHGEYFRERFYSEQIPMRLAEIVPEDEKVKKLTLVALAYSNSELWQWFAKKSGKPEEYGRYYIDISEMWQVIERMSKEEVEKTLKEASVLVALQTGVGSKTRHLVGKYLGLDLSKEWRITEEYLKKKTIKEILAIGELFKVFSDKKAQTFLHETLLKKRGKFTACKKAQLIRVFLESGVDLTGKVPKEILKTD